MRQALKSQERGQVLIIFAMLIVPVSLVIGVVAVDASMWQSERRGSQKDADLAALAGAYELIKPVPIAADAESKAREYADLNDESGNASVIEPIVVDSSCFGGGTRLDSVKLNIDHDSRTFFADAFGIAVPDIGAHARACAGSVISRTGLRPYAIERDPVCLGVSADPYQYAGREKYASLSAAKKTDTPTNTPTRTSTPTLTNTPASTNTPSGNTATPTNTPGGPAPTSTPTVGGPAPTSTPAGGCSPAKDSDCFTLKNGVMVPKFGSVCLLQDGKLDRNSSTRGLIDLELNGATCSINGGGANDVKTNIINGSGATCRVGDTIVPKPGQASTEIDSLQKLLDGQGVPPVRDGTDCDVKFAVPAPGIDHAGIDDPEEVLQRTDGGAPGPSADGVYQLRDCKTPRLIDIVVIGNFATDTTIKAFAAFYVLGCSLLDTPPPPAPAGTPPTDTPNKCASNVQKGQQGVWGIFYQKLDLGGDIGEFNEFGDNSIRLTE